MRRRAAREARGSVRRRGTTAALAAAARASVARLKRRAGDVTGGGEAEGGGNAVDGSLGEVAPLASIGIVEGETP